MWNIVYYNVERKELFIKPASLIDIRIGMTRQSNHIVTLHGSRKKETSHVRHPGRKIMNQIHSEWLFILLFVISANCGSDVDLCLQEESVGLNCTDESRKENVPLCEILRAKLSVTCVVLQLTDHISNAGKCKWLKSLSTSGYYSNSGVFHSLDNCFLFVLIHESKLTDLEFNLFGDSGHWGIYMHTSRCRNNEYQFEGIIFSDIFSI